MRRLESEVRPADEPAGGEGVARPGRVDDLLDACRSALDAVERCPGGAPLDDPGAPGQRAADDPVLVLVREDDVGRELVELGAEPLRAEVADGAPGREVDADPRSVGARELDRRGSPRT